MKVAVIGSRGLQIKKLEDYLPPETIEIVSGGAMGIDTCARDYANEHNIKLTEFLPDYSKHGRRAPLIRNDLIIEYSDLVLAFWDGESRGTWYVIDKCHKTNVPVQIIRL